MKRILALTTHSAHVETVWRSLQDLGFRVDTLQYDAIPAEHRNEKIVDKGRNGAYDCIVYIGGVERCPSPQAFKALRNVSAMVHICFDGSHPDWWPFLQTYNDERCFDIQVNLDGCLDTPITNFGLNLLQPIDPGWCKVRPWDQRSTLCSFVGNIEKSTSLKSRALWDMQERAGIKLCHFSVDPFTSMMQVMADTKITFNPAYKTDSNPNKLGVKGRVVEAAMAGCCLLETRGSPTQYWFEAGKDYMTYHSIDHACQMVMGHAAYYNADMAERFRHKAIREHHPSIFWQKVMWRAGIR